MKLADAKRKVRVINKFEGNITLGSIAIMYKESKIIDPTRTSEQILTSLQILYERGVVDFEFGEDEEAKVEKNTIEVKSENGEHTVFNPEKADSLIHVEEIKVGKPIEVSFNRLEASDFLAQHWKSIEKQLGEINKKESLELLLKVAKEQDLEGTKKYKLIEEKLQNH